MSVAGSSGRAVARHLLWDEAHGPYSTTSTYGRIYLPSYLDTYVDTQEYQ